MEDDLLHYARRLLRDLQPGDLEQTLSRMTAAAVEVLPDVTMASITIRHSDDRLETFAPTDDVLLPVDAAQYQFREGPCYEAATDEAYVVSSNLAADDRWPNYSKVALASHIRAQAGISLFDSPRFQGALNLYSSKVGAFADLEPLSELFSHQAAVVIGYAREISDLRQAMLTRQQIGQAIGIVMERYGLGEERAFAFLARLSQNRNEKLYVVAQEFRESAGETGSADVEG
ncbi:GAF and ANTAR domain-containing protein [Nocardioides sp. MH1]|uniref:GAF and ANTAR domain-containing protein n=1 Tax=Nocardioides sp. MH1 TaxID=3242490 RepID=UPI003520C396